MPENNIDLPPKRVATPVADVPPDFFPSEVGTKPQVQFLNFDDQKPKDDDKKPEV